MKTNNFRIIKEVTGDGTVHYLQRQYITLLSLIFGYENWHYVREGYSESRVPFQSEDFARDQVNIILGNENPIQTIIPV